MCVEGAVTGQLCQKWFAEFYSGDFLLDDAPWLGIPVEADSNQIETLIEEGILKKNPGENIQSDRIIYFLGKGG